MHFLFSFSFRFSFQLWTFPHTKSLIYLWVFLTEVLDLLDVFAHVFITWWPGSAILFTCILVGFPAFLVGYGFPFVLSYTQRLALPVVFQGSSQLALLPILKLRVFDAFAYVSSCILSSVPRLCMLRVHSLGVPSISRSFRYKLFRASPRVPLGFLVGSLWRSLCIGRGSLTRFPVLYTMRSLC